MPSLATNKPPRKARQPNIDKDKLDSLCERLQRAGQCRVSACFPGDKESTDALEFSDLVVDATGTGLDNSKKPCFETSRLNEHVAVMDLVYNPPETVLMREARVQGCKVVNGLGMLWGQGVRAFERWTGKEAPREIMRFALEKQVYGSIRHDKP